MAGHGDRAGRHETALVTFPVAMRDAVVTAAGAAGHSIVREVSLAGHGIRFTADERIAPAVLPAFSHLPAWTGGAALRVDVGVLQPEVRNTLALDTLDPGGALDHFDGGISVLHRQAHAAAVLDRHAGRLYALVRDPARDAATDAKPLQLPLSIYFGERDVDFVHAGLVAHAGTGVLVAGRSGSGKSTVAFSSLLEGLDFLGDDCVAVHQAAGRIDGYRVFADGCLEQSHLGRLPALRARGSRGDGKAVIEAAAPAAVGSTARIRAVMVPRITGAAGVSVAPIRSAEALMALAPSSIVKRAVPAGVVLSRLSRLVQSVPCYRLDMGRPERVGPAVRRFLESL